MDLKLAEQMAISVLRGDMAAARWLADWLSDNIDAVRMEPVIKIDCPLERVRVVLFQSNVSDHMDDAATLQAIREWLQYPYRPLLLTHIDSMQIYQLPE